MVESLYVKCNPPFRYFFSEALILYFSLGKTLRILIQSKNYLLFSIMCAYIREWVIDYTGQDKLSFSISCLQSILPSTFPKKKNEDQSTSELCVNMQQRQEYSSLMEVVEMGT